MYTINNLVSTDYWVMRSQLCGRGLQWAFTQVFSDRRKLRLVLGLGRLERALLRASNNPAELHRPRDCAP